MVCIIAAGISSVRWLRVAQREHYIAGYTIRFARRWWTCTPVNMLLALLGIVGVFVASNYPVAALATAAVVAAGPAGLSLRGRTSPLVWTRRLITTTTVAMLLALIWLGLIWDMQTFPERAAFLAAMVPLFVDGALFITGPFEHRVAKRYVRQAQAKLARLGCRRIAVTGSYGKTTVKNYLRVLLAPLGTVTVTPASFNNTAGLARSINDFLPEDTKIFVAEMDAYQRGEIRDLCAWVQPEISAITAIGPVHIERFGTEAAIAYALAEVAEHAHSVVLNVDNERLATMADGFAAANKQVIRCSTVVGDVVVSTDGEVRTVIVNGEKIGTVIGAQHVPVNIAVAVGVAVTAGVNPTDLTALFANLTVPEHRRTTATGRTGATIIDNTFNSNPAGALASLSLMESLATQSSKRVVVTPGMIELGRYQRQENQKFGEAAAAAATDLLVIGLTNKHALMNGARGGSAKVQWFVHRDQAVTWVREHVGTGDVVLYENDFPDHLP